MDLHPIRVVVRRTGLTPDTLRAWEKRYGAVAPSRSSGRRLYSDAEVERLRLLRTAVRGGRRIGQIARLDTVELRRLVARDEAAARPAAAPPDTPIPGESAAGPGTDGRAAFFRDGCVDAARTLDSRRLEDLLERAIVALPRAAVLDRVIVPLLRDVGEMWREGTLRIAQEHLVSSVVRTFLGPLIRGSQSADSTARLIVATPPGQLHELGALVASAAAASEGWNVVYLGTGLPAEEIAAAAAVVGPRAIALSLVYPPDDPRLPGELTRLRRLLPQDVALLVGGTASQAYLSTLQRIGAAALPDLAGLRAALDGLRRSRG